MAFRTLVVCALLVVTLSDSAAEALKVIYPSKFSDHHFTQAMRPLYGAPTFRGSFAATTRHRLVHVPLPGDACTLETLRAQLPPSGAKGCVFALHSNTPEQRACPESQKVLNAQILGAAGVVFLSKRPSQIVNLAGGAIVQQQVLAELADDGYGRSVVIPVEVLANDDSVILGKAIKESPGVLVTIGEVFPLPRPF